MLNAPGTRQTARTIDPTRQPRVEEIIEPLLQTSLDNRAQHPSSEMPRVLPNDHASASGDDSRTVRNPGNERHEGYPRTVSGTVVGGRRGEPRTSSSLFRARSALLRGLENDHRQLTDEYESLYHSYRQLREAHRVAVVDLHETQTACKKQQQQINHLREKLRDASALIDVRNQEVKVANAFLSKEDPVSASDVVRFVRDLNSEIMQTAAHLAENLPINRTHTPLAEEIPEGPYKSIFVPLVLPQGSGEELDVGSLELALQGFLAFSASGIANAWGYTHASRWYGELYSKVRETGA